MGSAALLLLADGRFPAGGHAHSSGVEAACADGAITDAMTLASFVRGRLHTSGQVDAVFAAAAAHGVHEVGVLDAALSARITSPRLRDVSRTLGRQTLRAGERVWPHERLAALRRASPPEGPHHAVALGAVAGAAGLDGHDAALCALHHLATSAATAAVRLLGLDPFEVHAVLSALAPDVDALAAAAVAASGGAVDRFPATSGPLVDILAEEHATWEVRLFAS
jgi:urease accessory protein